MCLRLELYMLSATIVGGPVSEYNSLKTLRYDTVAQHVGQD